MRRRLAIAILVPVLLFTTGAMMLQGCLKRADEDGEYSAH